MVYDSKKECEKFWLSRLKDEANLNFEIEDLRQIKETPDFLIRHQGRIVGVEVTELQIDRDRSPSKKDSALMREYSSQRRIVSRAQKLYFEKKVQPINALVCFRTGPGQSLKSVDHRGLAQSIAKSLYQIVLDPFDWCKLDPDSDPSVPPQVAFISACGLPSEITPRWQVIAPGWSKEFQPSDVESLLNQKNALISKYRETVTETWLLIVADGTIPPGMFRNQNQNHNDLPASKFDRTFLLCEPDRFFIEWLRGNSGHNT